MSWIWTAIVDFIMAWWSNRKQAIAHDQGVAALTIVNQEEKDHAVTEDILKGQHNLTDAERSQLLLPPEQRGISTITDRGE